MTLSVHLKSAPVQGRVQKKMSFFDGIFLHCFWMKITLLSKIKHWVLNYIILIICSYQLGPVPVLPAHIVHYAGNHYFTSDKDIFQGIHSGSLRLNQSTKKQKFHFKGIYCKAGLPSKHSGQLHQTLRASCSQMVFVVISSVANVFGNTECNTKKCTVSWKMQFESLSVYLLFGYNL